MVYYLQDYWIVKFGKWVCFQPKVALLSVTQNFPQGTSKHFKISQRQNMITVTYRCKTTSLDYRVTDINYFQQNQLSQCLHIFLPEDGNKN